MIKKLFQKNRGFSLVETLVAISILMVSIAGPMVLVGNGIKSSAFARDQVTAFYLAQDAIEALRYVRDNNRINKVTDSNPEGVPWDAISQYTCTDTESGRCAIDTVKIYNGDSGGINTTNDNQFMVMNSDGKYTYGTGETTRFKRWIVIDTASVDDNQEIQITVTVDWSSGGVARRFSVTENLFYWY